MSNYNDSLNFWKINGNGQVIQSRPEIPIDKNTLKVNYDPDYELYDII